MIRRDDIPRGFLGRGLVDRRFEGLLIVVPVLALLIVGCREFPVLLRLLDPGQEAARLLLLGHVQEELDGADAVVPQIALIVFDVLIAVVQQILLAEPVRMCLGLPQLLHLVDEQLFIVRAVENPDLALHGHRILHAPQIVVCHLFRRGGLERRLVQPVRRQARQDRADRPVLSGGVHGLEQEDHALFLLRVQLSLQFLNLFEILLHLRLGLFPIRLQRGFIGFDLGQLELSVSVVSVFFYHLYFPLHPVVVSL